MGQGSCVSSRSDCCPYFGLDNMCTTSCPTNYTANANTNFTCGKLKLIYRVNTLILYYIQCDYTCGTGEVANATCNGCNLIDICLRDKPCQNGELCILLSYPDNYSCNCSGTGYMGTNCTGKSSILLHTLFLCICYY